MEREKKLNINDMNELNNLVRHFNGAKLMLPSIYLYIDDQYIHVEKKILILIAGSMIGGMERNKNLKKLHKLLKVVLILN